MERRIDRREFITKVGLGGAVAFFGIAGGVDADSKGYVDSLHAEDAYQKFVNGEALSCAAECGDTKIPYSLGFDTSSPYKYKLVIPGIAKEAHPNVPEGWDYRVIPMLSAGEAPVESQKIERPHWSTDELKIPIFKGPSTEPLVALTIDDGNYNREEILQTIIDKDVSATFLTIGSVMDADPKFIEKAEKTGKITWANHTYEHLLLDDKSVSYIQDQLNHTESTLKRIVGATTLPLWRPPGGGTNSNAIAAAAALGYKSMLWNVSGDAGTQWTSWDPRALSNYYMGLLDVQKNPWGSIILMHFRESTAISKVPGVGSALSLVIDGVRARGMEPVSADRLLMAV